MVNVADIVNFNSDASCLFADNWLEAISGGDDSKFCQWLRLYIEGKKKVVLGITGATVADLLEYNPEAIDLIRGNADVFEIILRPFSHDLSPLRLPKGFKINFSLGKKILESSFGRYANFFLPPEFMLTSEQVWLLASLGVSGTFVQPGRFNRHFAKRIPLSPYKIKGIKGSNLDCIPFMQELTYAYLSSIANFNANDWNAKLLTHAQSGQTSFSWRDGESFLLFPDGLKREKFWLNSESPEINRIFLNDANITYIENDKLDHKYFRAYPPHPLSGWMRELKLFGLLNRIMEFEEHAGNFTSWQLTLWLELIRSDIFSSVEKTCPEIEILAAPESAQHDHFTILRSERAFEAEEMQSILFAAEADEIESIIASAKESFFRKTLARGKAIKKLIGICKQ
ncbi:MAG: hypothetical protein Kow0029_22240 [Candidatus Rifleibacteriota bacterium]